MKKHGNRRGFGSHQFWHDLRVALNSDGVIRCFPLAAPSSFPFSSWDGILAKWGYQLRPSRPGFDLLCASPEEPLRLSRRLQADRIWFALTRRSTLDGGVRQAMERAGHSVQERFLGNSLQRYLQNRQAEGSLVTACKGIYRTGKLKVPW